MTSDDLKLVTKCIDHEMRKWKALGREEVEDMTSNAWCVVLERWSRYNPERCGKNAFITRCVTSANLDWYRRFFKPRLKAGEDIDHIKATYNSALFILEDEHREDRYALIESRALLGELCDVLTDKERDIVSDLLNDMTLKDIGLRMGITESRVSQIMQHIRAKMLARAKDEE